MADEYKDPNTDIMKALSKAVDAATGETGTQYEYKNPNTDVIQKLEELIEAIATSGGGGHNYSTTEQVVGTWIDGKTVYEKTVSFVTPSSNAYTSQNLGLLTADIDDIWLAEGYAIGTNTVVNVAGYAGNVSDDEFMGFIYKGGTNITFEYRTGSSLQNGNAYLTIRYTKTST